MKLPYCHTRARGRRRKRGRPVPSALRLVIAQLLDRQFAVLDPKVWSCLAIGGQFVGLGALIVTHSARPHRGLILASAESTHSASIAIPRPQSSVWPALGQPTPATSAGPRSILCSKVGWQGVTWAGSSADSATLRCSTSADGRKLWVCRRLSC